MVSDCFIRFSGDGTCYSKEYHPSAYGAGLFARPVAISRVRGGTMALLSAVITTSLPGDECCVIWGCSRVDMIMQVGNITSLAVCSCPPYVVDLSR